MYLHAFSRRRSSDGLIEEEYELGRIADKTGYELRAAGVPKATAAFVEQIKQEILNLLERGQVICAPIARDLNSKGLLNYEGGTWTDRIVKSFADNYLPGRVRF